MNARSTQLHEKVAGRYDVHSERKCRANAK
jgi:hypothetical protein